jgi:hypothetical protein
VRRSPKPAPYRWSEPIPATFVLLCRDVGATFQRIVPLPRQPPLSIVIAQG